MSETMTDPEKDRREQVRTLVGRAVQAGVPAGQMTERQLWPGSMSRQQVPYPRAGLRAALDVARQAERRAHEFAKELRAEGVSWDDIADLLGIEWSPDYVRRERAYERVAADAGSSWSDALRLSWYCGGPGGCGAHITDYGPYNGHPDDTETGHADGCARKAAEVAAWDLKEEEAERRERVMARALPKVTDSFGKETIERVQHVESHGGRYQGWSTTEMLMVALVRRDDDRLSAMHFSTRKAALDRVVSSLGWRPENPQAWLRTVRAAALGIR